MKSLHELDKPSPMIGDNTIEMAAVKAIMEETKNDDNCEQQGNILDFPEESLAERWRK